MAYLGIVRRYNLIFWLIVTGVYFFEHGGYWSAHWLSKWCFLIWGFSLVVSVWAAKRTSWLYFPVMLYSLINASLIGIWPQSLYRDKVDIISLMAIEKNAIYAYLIILIAILLFAQFSVHRLRSVGLYFTAVFFVTSTTLFLRPKGYGHFSLGNASMAGSLIVALLPFAWNTLEYYTLIPTVMIRGLLLLMTLLAIYWTQASIPLGLLGVCLITFLWSAYPSKRRIIAVAIPPITGFILGAGFIYLGPELLENSGRFTLWKQIWHWYWAQANIWIGTGLGSAQVLTPIIQTAANPKIQDYFLWLHNEWFQMFMEMGVVGFTFVLLAWSKLLTRAARNPVLFSSFCTMSAMMVFNYPFRLPVHAMILLFLCCKIQRADFLSESYPSHSRRERSSGGGHQLGLELG